MKATSRQLQIVTLVLTALVVMIVFSIRSAHAADGNVINQLVAESALTKATKSGKLRVAWGPWFPFMYRDPKDGQIKGFTVDLYENYIGPAMGVKIEWVEQPWSTMLAGLQADRFDVAANANRSPKRLLTAFFAGPITQTNKSLLARKDNVGNYHSWQDADNPKTKICVALGTSADTAVTEYFKHADIMRVEGDPACVSALAGNRADLYATDIGVLVALVKAHPEFELVPNGTFGFTQLGIFVKQGDVVMLNWLDQHIRQLKVSGVIEELIEKYHLEGVKVVQ